MSRKRIVVLGSTGSIGTQALDVLDFHRERFEVVGLAAGSRIDLLAAQADATGVRIVAVGDPIAARRLAVERSDLQVLSGDEGVATLATMDADLVLNGITGAVGLAPTLAALNCGRPVALANKESLIIGGDLVVAAAEAAGGRQRMLIPVDSEHSAIAQCLRAGQPDEIRKLVLTASGGPFRGWSREQLDTATAEEALNHPTWDMGPMVTVNSATLMNKGLELIEAHLLFSCPWDRLEVVVHPQSVVHSMVEFADGSTMAQLSPPDMRLPIQLALAWPERLAGQLPSCDWTKASTLTFEPVDGSSFPALALAVAAGRRGGTFPAVLNAANEVAVEAFLAGALRFPDISGIVESCLETWDGVHPAAPRDVGDVAEADAWARSQAEASLALVSQR